MSPLTGVQILCALLLILVDRGESQTCYQCIYTGTPPTDPSIQTALGRMIGSRNQNSQCGSFPYYQSNSIQTINCQTLNISAYGLSLGGLPFTGWMCQKQTYTMTIQNYGNGISATIPVSVRGCVPIQWGNPYDQWNCWDMQTYNTNPYIMAILKSLYWPDLNVGAVPGTPEGSYCQCGSSWCNHGSLLRPSTIAVSLIAAIAATLHVTAHLLR